MMSPLAWYRRRDAAWRARWLAAPDTAWARRQAWIDMELVDHGILRRIWHNLAEVAPGVWRSNQPGPAQIRKLARRLGLKSIVNLRGANDYGSYLLERETCAELGIALHDTRLLSREPPSRDSLHRLRTTFEQAETPMLLHCKSGADRAGLAAAVYLLMHGYPVARARAALGLRYLHVRQAKTGVLDHFVEAYARAQATSGIGFFDWVDTEYDPAAMAAEFRSSRAADALVGGLLRRE